MKLTHTATREGKLLSFLRRELEMSSGLVKRLKYQRAFTVNGAAVYTDYPIRPGDRIEVLLDEPTPEYPAEDGSLSILFEDEWLLAVDKPPGILMHPSHTRNTGTLANFLTAYYRKTGQSCAVHPVSRLDRDTFGVVLFAKNSHVHAKMHALHRVGGIDKRYQALAVGAPPQSEGRIDAPIARVEGSSLLRCLREDGKPAVSEYRLLSTLDLAALPCSVLALHPLTGRTHQLRLHCLHIGCPILGDPQYYTEASAALSAQLNLTGQQLCAVRLRFVHPMTGQPICITSRRSVLRQAAGGTVAAEP